MPESLQWCWGRVLGFLFERVLGITTLVMEHPSLEANIARDEMEEVREEDGDGEIQFATAFIPFIPPSGGWPERACSLESRGAAKTIVTQLYIQFIHTFQKGK